MIVPDEARSHPLRYLLFFHVREALPRSYEARPAVRYGFNIDRELLEVLSRR